MSSVPNAGLLNRLDGLDAFIEESAKLWNVPGGAVAVIKDTEVVYNKGFGFRETGSTVKPDADTQYWIASNTKAFTAASVMILVDEGKLELDKPIKSYIPWFKMYDTFATERVTARDLLTHRTGVPDHGWAFHNSKWTRKDLVERIQYLEPNHDLRNYLQYNNKMYMVAAYLVEYITGQTWESFVQERILNPLGMTSTYFNRTKSRNTGNFARHYYDENGKQNEYKINPGEDPETFWPMGPAGSICSCTKDLVKWLSVFMNKGEYNGIRILSEKSVLEMTRPQMVDTAKLNFIEQGHLSTCLGWFSLYHRGHHVVAHGGFYGSDILFLPNDGIGVIYLTSKNTPLCDVIANTAFDRLLGMDEMPWNQKFKALAEKNKTAEHNTMPLEDEEIGTESKPLLPLEKYAGRYDHLAYGDFTINYDGNKLFCHKFGKDIPFRHDRDNTFELISETGDPIIKFSFQIDEKGSVTSASSPMEPLVKDIVFERVI